MTKNKNCQRTAIDIRKNIINTASYHNHSNIGKMVSLSEIGECSSNMNNVPQTRPMSKIWSDYYKNINEFKYDMVYIESHSFFLKVDSKWKDEYDSVKESYNQLCSMQQNNIGSISDYSEAAEEMLSKIVLVKNKISRSCNEIRISAAILLYIAFIFVMFFL